MARLQKHRRKSSTKKTSQYWATFVIAPCLFFGVLLFVKSKLNSQLKAPVTQTHSESEKVLPNFTLTTLDGTTEKFESLGKKVYLIHFWATWCEACLDEMPEIQKLRETFKEQGFEVLGVNLDENPSAVLPEKIQSYKIDFPNFTDPDGATAEFFQVYAIPMSVIINSKREVLFTKNGPENWNSPIMHSQVKKWLN